MPLRFFTVCSNNYLAHATTLGRQLEKFHPDASFTIFLTDKQIGYDSGLVPYRVVLMERLGLADELGMITRYNITELNTSIKPWCFQYLFRENEDPVVYLDPDIFVVSALSEVANELATSDAVLTPHILRPSPEHGYPTENFLRLGIYNLGFLALRPAADTIGFLRWWAERLETDCVIDTQRGVFVDQKWADFAPAFVERCKVLRHPGYNVAYWNIHNRKLVETSDSVLANGQPLRFVHFSGLPSESESGSISGQMKELTAENSPVLNELADSYRDLLVENGQATYHSTNFSYFVSPKSDRNEHRPDLQSPEDATNARLQNYFVVRSFLDHEDYDEFRRQNPILLEQAKTNEALLRESLARGDTKDSLSPIDNSRIRLHFDSQTWPELASIDGVSSSVRALGHVFVQELMPRSTAPILVQGTGQELYDLLAPRFSQLHVGGEPHPQPGVMEYAISGQMNSSEADIAMHSLVAGGFYVTIAQGDQAWAVFDAMQSLGFVNRLALHCWSNRFGYLGEDRFILLGQRPKTS